MSLLYVPYARRVGRFPPKAFAVLLSVCLLFEAAIRPVAAKVLPTIKIPQRNVLVKDDHEDLISCEAGGTDTSTGGTNTRGGKTSGAPSGSPALELNLSHNSLNGAASIWGFGWGTELDQKLVQNPNNSVTWIDGAGVKRIYFVQPSTDSTRTFARPLNTYSDMTVAASDGSGNPTEIDLREKQGTSRRFKLFGSTFTFLLDSLTDRNGNTLSFTRDAQDRMTRITDVHGRHLDFTYDPDGRVATVVDSGGRTTSFGYDAAGEKTSEAGPEGTTTYAYDADHRITQITYPNGGTRSYTYDAQGRILTESDDGGANGRSYVYEPTRTLVTDSLGRTTAYEFVEKNGLRKLSRIVAPGNRVTEFTYDSNFNLVSKRDPLNRLTTYEYDAEGNLTKTIDPALGETPLAYAPSFNQGTSITDPRGKTTTLSYDSAGNLTGYTDPLSNTTQMGYDAQGHVTSFSNPLSKTTSWGYDPATGALTSETDALNRTSSLVRDALSRITQTTDGAGKVTQFEYDAAGNLVRTVDAALGVTQYAYDPGRKSRFLKSITDAENHATVFGYDPIGRLTSVTNPLNQARGFAYDTEGNLISASDAKSQSTSYTYDALNRLTTKTTPEGILSYAHDDAGNLTGVSHHNGSDFSRSYDALNRITQETQVLPGGFSATIGYTYDANGNRTTMTTPWGTFSYTYDDANRLTSLTNPDSRTISFQYDSFGRRTQMDYPNGIRVTYAYDGANQLTRIEHKRLSNSVVLSANDYAYDLAGNRTSSTDLTGAHSYTYDDLHRLTAATHPAGSALPIQNETFSYDKVGNRLSDAGASGYAYDSANRLSENALFSYSHDPNGSRTTKVVKANNDTATYTYDSQNRLIQIDLPDGLIISQVYDGLGRRIERGTGQPPSLAKTRYVYDGESILALVDDSNNLIALFTHGLGIDEPLGVKDSGGEYFYHADGLGSVVALSNASGVVVEKVEYAAFGEPVFIDVRGPPTTSDRSFTASPYSFTGREWDAESKTYFHRTRHYDPAIGRFIQEDSLGPRASLNLFAYPGNNPFLLKDPFGRYGTNDCTYYSARCKESGGKYYCEKAQYFCNDFPLFKKYPDPDPTRDDDFEGWTRCTRQCLQDCDFVERIFSPKCEEFPDPSTDEFGDFKPKACHYLCYTACFGWGIHNYLGSRKP